MGLFTWIIVSIMDSIRVCIMVRVGMKVRAKQSLQIQHV